jgi:hypothetical protein
VRAAPPDTKSDHSCQGGEGDYVPSGDYCGQVMFEFTELTMVHRKHFYNPTKETFDD